MVEEELFEKAREYAERTLTPEWPLSVGDIRDAVIYGYSLANKWHDLKKDPSDLPKVNTPATIKDEYGNLLIAWYSLETKSWWPSPEPDFGIDYEVPVVKWKEIKDD